MARTQKSSGRTVDLPGADALPKVGTVAAPVTKIARVIALLERTGGATVADLIESTGWLPHTTRAALTGLRKKGYVIVKERREGATVYSIGKSA